VRPPSADRTRTPARDGIRPSIPGRRSGARSVRPPGGARPRSAGHKDDREKGTPSPLRAGSLQRIRPPRWCFRRHMFPCLRPCRRRNARGSRTRGPDPDTRSASRWSCSPPNSHPRVDCFRHHNFRRSQVRFDRCHSLHDTRPRRRRRLPYSRSCLALRSHRTQSAPGSSVHRVPWSHPELHGNRRTRSSPCCSSPGSRRWPRPRRSRSSFRKPRRSLPTKTFRSGCHLQGTDGRHGFRGASVRALPDRHPTLSLPGG